MGPYHISRMNAIASELGDANVTVLEICSKDDHDWNLKGFSKKFNYVNVLGDETLSTNSLKKAKPILSEFFKDNHFDIIVNGCGYFDFSLRSVLNKRKKNQKLVLWSESTIQDNSNTWLKKLVKMYANSIYDGAIVAGNRHKEFLKEIGFKNKPIGIVGNVVDNEFYKRTEQIHGNNQFLFVGRFLSIKNISKLITAFQLINDQIPDWKLKLVGDGPDRSKVENQIINNHLSDKVFISGLLDPNALKSVYEESDVFILPSYSEPWGLVTNEALASKLPVIISKQSGASEILTHAENGFIFDAYDEVELSQLMLTLAKNEELRIKIGERGYQLIQQFSPENYAKHSISLFKSFVV